MELAMAQKHSSDSEKSKNGAAPANGSARTVTLGKDYVYER